MLLHIHKGKAQKANSNITNLSTTWFEQEALRNQSALGPTEGASSYGGRAAMATDKTRPGGNTSTVM